MAKYELDARERANYRASIRETERRAARQNVAAEEAGLMNVGTGADAGVRALAWAMGKVAGVPSLPPIPGPTQDAHDKRVAQLLSENCCLRVELADAEAERDAALARVRELEAGE